VVTVAVKVFEVIVLLRVRDTGDRPPLIASSETCQKVNIVVADVTTQGGVSGHEEAVQQMKNAASKWAFSMKESKE
jgi:hypothetical protein